MSTSIIKLAPITDTVVTSGSVAGPPTMLKSVQVVSRSSVVVLDAVSLPVPTCSMFFLGVCHWLCLNLPYSPFGVLVGAWVSPPWCNKHLWCGISCHSCGTQRLWRCTVRACFPPQQWQSSVVGHFQTMWMGATVIGRSSLGTLLKARFASTSNCRCICWSFTQQTSLFRSKSVRKSPKLQCSERMRNWLFWDGLSILTCARVEKEPLNSSWWLWMMMIMNCVHDLFKILHPLAWQELLGCESTGTWELHTTQKNHTLLSSILHVVCNEVLLQPLSVGDPIFFGKVEFTHVPSIAIVEFTLVAKLWYTCERSRLTWIDYSVWQNNTAHTILWIYKKNEISYRNTIEVPQTTV